MDKKQEVSNFGIFTDDFGLFNKLKEQKFIEVSDYIYGKCKPSNDPSKPFTCVNGLVNTNWKYFISLVSSPKVIDK